MKLVIAGDKDSTLTVAFRLSQSGGDIDVFANDAIVGWFEMDGENKIRFSAAPISDSNANYFARDGKKQLATV